MRRPFCLTFHWAQKARVPWLFGDVLSKARAKSRTIMFDPDFYLVLKGSIRPLQLQRERVELRRRSRPNRVSGGEWQSTEAVS